MQLLHTTIASMRVPAVGAMKDVWIALRQTGPQFAHVPEALSHWEHRAEPVGPCLCMSCCRRSSTECFALPWALPITILIGHGLESSFDLQHVCDLCVPK